MNRADWSFMLTESQSSDPIAARFPRTAREAFGHDAPLRTDLSFLPRHRGGLVGVVVAVAILAAFALAGLKP